MSETLTAWNEARRLADEIELEIHLAKMEARDRWQALEPRLRRLEHAISQAGKHIGAALDREVAAIGVALRRLRDDLPPPESD